ncbi:MAG: HD domain-containing protein [Candidatus Paceibacterota bacterium]
MNFTSRIDEAIKLASRLHRHQIRKDSGHTPYISHLVSVAMLLTEAKCDEDTIIAGLMHDSLEDVPNYSYKNLVGDCGERVAEIVKRVTEPLDANKLDDEQMPWLERKEIYLTNLRAGEKESVMVSAGDKIHNTESFMSDISREGEDFISRFGSSLRNKLWFHEKVLEIVEEKLGKEHILVVRLSSCTEDFRKLVTQYEQK